MITTVRDTNTNLAEVKKKILNYLRAQKIGMDRGLAFAPSTAKLIKQMKLPPRVARKALAELREEKAVQYLNSEHGWTPL